MSQVIGDELLGISQRRSIRLRYGVLSSHGLPVWTRPMLGCRSPNIGSRQTTLPFVFSSVSACLVMLGGDACASPLRLRYFSFLDIFFM